MFVLLLLLSMYVCMCTGIDAVGLVQCTSPFVTVHHLEMAIEKMISGASSVFSVVRSHSLRWKEEEEEDQSK